MKKWLVLACTGVSAVGFGLAALVLGATLFGWDPSAHAPWIRRLREVSLVMFGLTFLLPGLHSLRHPSHVAQTPLRFARIFVLTLVAIAILNFALVMGARTDVTAASQQQRATEFPRSKLNSLRAEAGFWLVLFGVPMLGFYFERPRFQAEGNGASRRTCST